MAHAPDEMNRVHIIFMNYHQDENTQSLTENAGAWRPGWEIFWKLFMRRAGLEQLSDFRRQSRAQHSCFFGRLCPRSAGTSCRVRSGPSHSMLPRRGQELCHHLLRHAWGVFPTLLLLARALPLSLVRELRAEGWVCVSS